MNNLTILNLFGAGELVNDNDFAQILLREVQRAYLLLHQKNDEISGLRESLKRSLEDKEIDEVKFNLKNKDVMIGDLASALRAAKGYQNQDEFHKLLLENSLLKQQVIWCILSFRSNLFKKLLHHCYSP